MQLTNYSAIDLRHGAAKVLDARDHSIRRITTGERMTRASDDPGAMAVASKLEATNRQRMALRTNLQNTRTYLDSQVEGLGKVNDVYERMSVIATQSLDVVLSDADRAALDVEFQELVVGLDKLLNEKFNGVRLFERSVSCGGPQKISFDSNLDETQSPTTNTGSTQQWIATKDVGTTDGKLTLQMNSGEFPESYVVSQGTDVIFTTGQWQTRGNAYQWDFDEFVIEFGAGNPTTYTYNELDTGGEFGIKQPTLPANKIPGYDNPTGTPDAPDPNGTYDNTAGGFGSAQLAQVTTNPAPGDSTDLTIMIESNGTQFQAEGEFEPIFVDHDQAILSDVSGGTMTVAAKGFSAMSGYDVTTAANAQAALSKLVDEVDCVLYDRFGAVQAEISRVDQRLDELAGEIVQGEAAYGRVADLDYAREMTHFATNTMQLNVMTASMATANRATDVLMPLTTQQFQSAVTQRFQLI